MTITVVANDLPQAYVVAALQATIVGVDIETSGLDITKDSIACVQMHVPEYGTVMVRYLDDVPAHLAMLLESRRVTKVFQHAPFDLSFLMRDFPFIQPHTICDTKIAADILDPEGKLFIHPITNKPSNSLIALVWHYYEDLLDKSIAVSNWFQDELSQEQLAYAEKDVLYLPDLLRKLERAIFDKDHTYINTLHRAYHDLPAKAVARIKSPALAA